MKRSASRTGGKMITPFSLTESLQGWRGLKRKGVFVVMDILEQAQIILEEVDGEYSIPGYLEDDVLRGIIAGLRRIEKEGGTNGGNTL